MISKYNMNDISLCGDNMNKFCNKCQTIKNIDLFHKDSKKKDGACTFCKECQSVYSKQHNLKNKEKKKLNGDTWRENNAERQRKNTKKYYQSNKEEINFKNRQKYNNNPLISKDRDLKKMYGISLEKYNEILCSQNNSCAICKKHKDEFTKALAVDHCHTTGKVRGLLCTNCNRALGNIRDSIDGLKNAILYLEKPWI